MQDVFLGAPSQDQARQTGWFDECSQEVRFGIISCCVLEETHDESNFDWKTTQSSKGKAYVCLFLMF